MFWSIDKNVVTCGLQDTIQCSNGFTEHNYHNNYTESIALIVFSLVCIFTLYTIVEINFTI